MPVDDPSDTILTLSELGGKTAGLDIISRFTQDKFTPNIYDGTRQYRAIVLTTPIAIPAETFIENEGIRLSTTLPPLAGDPNYAHYICRCRILERNSPHEQIPAPSNVTDPTTEDAEKIALHPIFATRSAITGQGAPNIGSIVWVTFEKGPAGGRMYKGQILTGDYRTLPTPAGYTTAGPGGALGASCSPTQKTAEAPAPANWPELVLWQAIADEGSSKNWTDVKPLNGGIIGAAHWTTSGLGGLYDQIDKEYPGGLKALFGKSRAEMSSYERDCKAKNCYGLSWWKGGFEKFVKSPQSKQIQINAWKRKYATKVDHYMKKYGWADTLRNKAIAGGIINSAGGGGLEKYSANGTRGPEQTIQAYASDPDHRAHYSRRLARINKYMPCAEAAAEAADPALGGTGPALGAGRSADGPAWAPDDPRWGGVVEGKNVTLHPDLIKRSEAKAAAAEERLRRERTEED